MGFFKDARHRLGVHSGEWAYTAAGSCEQTRACTGCPDISTRVKHTKDPWLYREPRDTNACTMDQVCARCGETETKQEHSTRWFYYDELADDPALPRGYRRERSACAQICLCTYCKLVTSTGDVVKHQLVSLGRPDGGEPAYYYKCARCGTVEKQRVLL